MAGKIMLCRCEDVTLSDLEHCVGRGYRDIEEVKRYTGFGTGWCQGKWCLALCARLVHERGGDVDKPITPRPPIRAVRIAQAPAPAARRRLAWRNVLGRVAA